MAADPEYFEVFLAGLKFLIFALSPVFGKPFVIFLTNLCRGSVNFSLLEHNLVLSISEL